MCKHCSGLKANISKETTEHTIKEVSVEPHNTNTPINSRNSILAAEDTPTTFVKTNNKQQQTILINNCGDLYSEL